MKKPEPEPKQPFSLLETVLLFTVVGVWVVIFVVESARDYGCDPTFWTWGCP